MSRSPPPVGVIARRRSPVRIRLAPSRAAGIHGCVRLDDARSGEQPFTVSAALAAGVGVGPTTGITSARRNPRVLIADDHAATRVGIRLALEESGFVVC